MLQARLDMDMPEKCMWDCPFCDGEGGECKLSISDIATSSKGRPKDCPLKEVSWLCDEVEVTFGAGYHAVEFRFSDGTIKQVNIAKFDEKLTRTRRGTAASIMKGK